MTVVRADTVGIGDRLRARDGTELEVTRIDHGFLGTPQMIAFVEDSDRQWFKLPAPAEGEVELLSRGDGIPHEDLPRVRPPR